MPRDYTIQSARNAGEKDNPHGGTLVKWYLKLADSEAGDDDVYTQKKPGNDLAEGMSIYGRLEKGEFGWRLFPEQNPNAGSGSQGSSGGTFNASRYERVPDNSDRSARIERQHSQHMALLFFAAIDHEMQPPLPEYLDRILKPIIDWFDADVGGGSTQATHDAPPAAADVSAEPWVTRAPTAAEGMQVKPVEEASPPQKGKLTQLFGKAGLSRDAMKAVVLFRCRSEKATKDGASKLIQDLMDGATHDTLLAEIHDAKRAGDAVAIRAAKLIPSDTPLAEPEPEVVPPNGDEVPF